MKENNNFLVTLLSSLLLLSCLIAGFFAYQTQKLVSELTIYRLQPTQTPTPTPDPTANWKTYLAKDGSFSFKYPASILLDNFYDTKSGSPIKSILSGFEFDNLDNQTIGTFSIYDSKNQSLNDFVSSNKNVIYPEDISKVKDLKIGNINLEEFVYETGIYYIFSMDRKVFSFNSHSEPDLFKKILSTFQFDIEKSVACTEEAKICPDGSAVGRTGPNCEFASCPN